MSAVKRPKVDNKGSAEVPIAVVSPVHGPGQRIATRGWSFEIINALVDATKEELVETGEFNIGITVKAIHASRLSGASLHEQGVISLCDFSNFYCYFVNILCFGV